jgi:exoribonuclease II
MRAHGLDPGFPPEVMATVAALAGPPCTTEERIRDLRALPWCSIDNDDSRDLDQLSFAEPLGSGRVRVCVAIADVDATVTRGSAVDRHALVNTTSVYTTAAIFPMLPERLSTDITSLAANQDRLAIVVEFVVLADGTLSGSDVYGGLVRNRAKLAYRGVNAWLNGEGGRFPGQPRRSRVWTSSSACRTVLRNCLAPSGRGTALSISIAWRCGQSSRATPCSSFIPNRRAGQRA